MTILNFWMKLCKYRLDGPGSGKTPAYSERSETAVLQHGYHGSSMNQIALEAGVTKLTVYNHFQDKATLFSCAVEETCEAILQESPKVLQPDSDFQQELYQICLRSFNIANLPEALKLDLLIMQLAYEKIRWRNVFIQPHISS